MKVSLAINSNSSVPFSESFVRLDEVRDGERRVDVTGVAFAEEVDEETVELRIHGAGEFVVTGACIRAVYDM